MTGSWPAHRPGPTNVWFDHCTACNKLPSNPSLRTPLNYRQFVWSQNCQKSHIPYLYNTDTSVKQTLGSVPLVSVLKSFDCMPCWGELRTLRDQSVVDVSVEKK